MMQEPEDAGDLGRAPAFMPGTRVQAVKDVRNDGTHPDASAGAVLVRAGDIGFVRELGSFLQRYRIYEVDFIASQRVVGMRAGELTTAEPDRV